MATPKRRHGEAPPVAEPESISAFIARVLNQLSLSAWLPGAFLIASATALVWFRRSGEVTFSGFGSYVDANWIAVLVLALPSLVLTTLLTQAFAFEAIRTLEGYWRGPASWLRTVCISWQVRRKRSLDKRYGNAIASAFRSARPRLIDLQIDGMVLLAIEAECEGKSKPAGLSSTQEAEAVSLEWWDQCEPGDLAKMTRLDRDRLDYPEDSRVMPTKLGNVLRAAEDGLQNVDGNLEGFVMAHRDSAPARVLEHHDQFRARMDMYCTLVFVAAVAALVAVPLLWDLTPLERVGVPLALLVISLASYGAAVSSARGYTVALKAIDDSVASAKS